MKKENVRLEGLRGTWYVIDSHRTESGTMFYLWENEQYGDELPAVLTDDKLSVLDTDCYSGIVIALQDNGLFTNWEDETELEEEMALWELEDKELLYDDEISKEAYMTKQKKTEVVIKTEERFGAIGVSIYIDGGLSTHVVHAVRLFEEIRTLQALGIFDITFQW